MDEKKVLILCTGNSARSQMGEGLLRHMAGDGWEVESAGTKPVGLNPMAVEAMREVGIDISQQRSKSVSEFDGKKFDFVITVCDSAAESCPVFPNAPTRIHWSLPDPASAQGTHEEKLTAFRTVRERLSQHLHEWLAQIASI
jgi:arsenate reductase (thioredoxin)